MENELESLNKILQNDQFRYLFLVSLISSDTNVTIEDCNDNLSDLNYIKDNIDKLDLTDEIKNEVIKKVNEGIEILERDIKNILNK
jgi:hypothetical protein